MYNIIPVIELGHFCIVTHTYAVSTQPQHFLCQWQNYAKPLPVSKRILKIKLMLS